MQFVRRFGPLVLVSLAMAAPVLGQQAQGAPPASAPQAMAKPQSEPTVAATVEREVGMYEKIMVGAAEAMPEEKFNFTPASLHIPGSAFTDVRTFAALVKHTAAINYLFWSAVTGEKAPENIKGPNGPDDLKTKAQIVQFLKDSFAVGHRAAQTLTPANIVEPAPFGNGTAPRLFLATFALIHCGDGYGQMVEYLRMNGIVPPASRGN
jgi:hypothetical protein